MKGFYRLLIYINVTYSELVYKNSFIIIMQRQSLRFLSATISLLLLSLNPAKANEPTGNAANGENKIAMCIGCHGIVGYQSSFPEVYKVPMISGQTSKYIVNSLKAYQSGERKHPTMRSVAKGLSEQDMLDIAAYYEKHGTSTSLPEQASAAPEKVNNLLTKGACNSCHGANYSKPIDPNRKATRHGVAATPSWAALPSSSAMPNSRNSPTTSANSPVSCKLSHKPSSADPLALLLITSE